MSNNYPIISYLMMVRYRYKDINAKKGTIFNFFDSALEKIFKKDREKVEFLIKFDVDDERAKKEILNGQLDKYPFKIRTFTFERWEGINSANYILSFLFTQRNKNSKFIGIAGDDSIVFNFTDGVISIIEDDMNNDYRIFLTREHTKEKLEAVKDYKNNFLWANSDYTDPYPIISTKLLEICSVYGFHRDVDVWISLLNVILYSKYGINLVRNFETYQPLLRENNQPEDIEIDDFYHKNHFNFDMMTHHTKIDSYYYALVEQQAKNIYLNIKEDGLLNKIKE